ncbi:hypothetical protein JHK84_055414 [Glycine max]|nr:hypothetical protein JHK84_055414 [Glycine max]
MPDASTNKVEPILDTGLDDEDPRSNDIVNPDGEEIYFNRTKGHLRRSTIKRSFDFERRETLRHWTISDLMYDIQRERRRKSPRVNRIVGRD